MTIKVQILTPGKSNFMESSLVKSWFTGLAK